MIAPCVPLITADPYFSVWSKNQILTQSDTIHWTGMENTVRGTVILDGTPYRFLGCESNVEAIPQTAIAINALSTTAVFANDKIRLTVRFTSPLLPDDLLLLSTPITYLTIMWESLDGMPHDVKIRIAAKESLCLDHAGESPVTADTVPLANGNAVKMGNTVQNILGRCGDLVRINWGYFYLACADKKSQTAISAEDSSTYVLAEANATEKEEKLFLFAYDDINSMQYFGTPLKSLWNQSQTIEKAMEKAIRDYPSVMTRCRDFAEKLSRDAMAAGGKRYAELLSVAYRQVMAAHKIVVDENGELLFISKECGSCGLAATVDVSYPSSPLFLLYNPELLKAMLRPIYRFVNSSRWPYPFAPHDVGMYPVLNGQLYGYDKKTDSFLLEKQMPIEECGNMLILEACIAIATGNADFANAHLPILTVWCDHLMQYGEDPGEQLCTDDFAGHMAHNCNLSVKAVLGVEAMAILLSHSDEKKAKFYHKKAVSMASSWCKRAVETDGTTKLAFDRANTFSLKYNLIWDILWGTSLFPKDLLHAEMHSYKKYENAYGVPLDSRADYTKSDWLMWVAAMLDTKEEFEDFIEPLCRFYEDSEFHVPLADWYDTKTAAFIEFRNRTVQGGLFVKLLMASGNMHLTL